MRMPYSPIVESLPSVTPFVGPETLERMSGKPIELRLGANESPFGSSEAAISAMADQLSQVQNYGDPDGFALRSELARLHNVSINNISLGSGIDELLGLACRLFAGEGSYVVTSLGTYPTFEYVARGCGGQIERVPYRDEAPDLEGLVELAKRTSSRVVYLANPDNPSGAWHYPNQVVQLRARLPENSVLFLDEAYSDFAPGIGPIDTGDPQVIRFRTFSKAHGLAGMRVGYVIAHSDHVAALDRIRLHFGVNRVAQAGALAALHDLGFVRNVVIQTDQGRAKLRSFFESFSLRCLPSYTNFLTVDVGSREVAERILRDLLFEGVFIRKPGAPPLDRCIRVTIGREDQIARFQERFLKVMANERNLAMPVG